MKCRNYLLNYPKMPYNAQILYSRFRERMLSSAIAESSVVAYNARISHLEPLAEARFEKKSVEQWLENIRKTRPQNSARELVRLAKKFWDFGVEKGAWKGANPFNRIRPSPTEPSKEIFLSPNQIREVLEKAPDIETRAFWACCALAGLRQSEAAALKYEQIGRSASKITGLPKRGNAPDFVEINDELQSLLQNLIYAPPP